MVSAGEPVRLHGIEQGSGPAVVLLHGWGSTSHMWDRIVNALSHRFRVLAPDLRGIGGSPVPGTGYDKATMAADVATFVADRAVSRCAVVGHDWGGCVGYLFAALHPQTVTHLALLESVLPGVSYQMDLRRSEPLWHAAFHAAPGLAESVIRGTEATYLEWFYREFSHPTASISARVIDEYARAYTKPGAFAASMEWYRTMDKDAADVRAVARRRLTVPALALGGDSCLGLSPLRCLREVASDVTGGVVPECGHWMADEQPAATARRLAAFLGR